MTTDPRIIFGVANAAFSILKFMFDKTTSRLKTIEKDLSRINAILEMQSDAFGALNDKFDDDISRRLNSAFCALLDSIDATSAAERNSLLQSAYENFTDLSFINPRGKTKLSGDKYLDNRFIAVLSHYGRFLYFGVRERYKDCLYQVYDATEKYPEVGCMVFDKQFYSQDYSVKFAELDSELMKHSYNFESFASEQLLSHYAIVSVLGETEIEGIGMDETGVLLSFEKEELIEDLQEECRKVKNHIDNEED